MLDRVRRPAAGAAPAPVQQLSPAARVTVVCRANLYRSPIAAALLRRHLAARDVEATIDSAGLAAVAGEASPTQVARQRGIELSEHRSRLLEPSAVYGADLVLTMEHHQSAEVMLLAPDAWPHVFTIREAVRRAEEVGARRNGQSLAQWIARVHRGRTRLDVVGAWGDDIVDPAGASAADLLDTIDTLDALVERLVALGWPR